MSSRCPVFSVGGFMKTRKLIVAAFFAAVTCIGTLLRLPIPLDMGYINLGDCFVLLSSWFLGPLYGAAAAGVGSALADIFAGFANYAPITLIIKATMAIVAYFIVGKANHLSPVPIKRILSGIAAEVIMVGGYFFAEYFILGYGIGAAASIPFNAIQGTAGIIGGMLLFMALNKVKLFKEL